MAVNIATVCCHNLITHFVGWWLGEWGHKVIYKGSQTLLGKAPVPVLRWLHDTRYGTALILSQDPPHMHPAGKIEGLASKTMVNGQVQHDEISMDASHNFISMMNKGWSFQ